MSQQLTSEEKLRYNRHIILPEIGIEGQQKLKNTSLLVIGAGGLGCPLLQYVAAAGIGKIGIMDHDVVDASNLHRQILFTTEDIGKPKAEVAKSKLLANNPHIEVFAIHESISKSNALDYINEYDIIADGSDNFATRYLVNDACIIKNKPLIFGAIFKFEGQLSVFNYKNGPSYRCLFPEQPAADSIPTCSQIGVMGVLPGIIGSMMANEVIKVVLNSDSTLSGKFLTVDILSNNFIEFGISRNEENFALTTLGNYHINECTTSQIPSISVDELHESYENHVLIDIRTDDERSLAQLPNSLHLPKDTLAESISKIPRDQSIVVYCHFGKQSQEVVQLLLENYGFNKVYNLEGGIHEWAQEIDASIGVY